MKKLHIVAIIIIAIAIGLIFVSLRDTSTYADCTEAAANPDRKYHVVGKLDRDKQQIYDPAINPDQFSFSMTDNKGNSKIVVLHKSKPQDFDKSEQIVLIGKMRQEEFH